MTDVVIVATGLANTASVVAAFKRLGTEPVITRQVDEVRTARAVVVPGVGAFGPGMQSLRDAGLVDVLRDRVAADPLAFTFPTVEDGVLGVKFVEAVVESNAQDGRWVSARLPQ